MYDVKGKGIGKRKKKKSVADEPVRNPFIFTFSKRVGYGSLKRLPCEIMPKSKETKNTGFLKFHAKNPKEYGFKRKADSLLDKILTNRVAYIKIGSEQF